MLDGETFAATSQPKDLFELVRKEDIDALMSVFPVTRLHYVASDGFALFMREAVVNMDDETFVLVLKYHLSTCERDDFVGATSHVIDVFRKLGKLVTANSICRAFHYIYGGHVLWSTQ
ncbi:hypothetical protein [Bacteroides sp.]|uniref:hypothetical protein n=1 Tax=Bacteroides sp. TaxID=29523 RepID=UPI0026360D1B|nr:hypothetical protein [Bacteroides sp.]MDD3041198.1 hypothetical protein [Bacteroides sp.]